MMQKLSGLIFVSALLCAGGAQAFDNHHVNGAAVDIFDQKANTPPKAYGGVNQTPQFGTGGGAGKLDPKAARGEGGGKGKVSLEPPNPCKGCAQ